MASFGAVLVVLTVIVALLATVGVDARQLFKVSAALDAVRCDSDADVTPPCTASLQTRVQGSASAVEVGGHYVLSFANLASFSNPRYARVDVTHAVPDMTEQLSVAFWLKMTNPDNMRGNVRFVTNQPETFSTVNNRSSRVQHAVVFPQLNTRSAFGNTIDMRCLLRLYNGTNPNTPIQADLRSNNKVVFINRWHHVAVVYNATRLTIYLDAQQVATGFYAGAKHVIFPPGPGKFSIGGVTPGTLPSNLNATQFETVWEDAGLVGNMDDVRLFDQALSESELKLVYFGYDPNFGGSIQNSPPKVLDLPTWMFDLTAQNATTHRDKFRQYTSAANDSLWYVTLRGSTATAWTRGYQANATDMEEFSMPFKPETSLQTLNASSINEYFLLFTHDISTFPPKAASVQRVGRQFAVAIGQDVATLPNFDGTTNNRPELHCRGIRIASFGGDTAYSVFKSWTQFDIGSCRGNDRNEFFRLAIRVTALPNTTISVRFYEFVSDPYEFMLRNYSAFELPFARDVNITAPPPTDPTSSSTDPTSSFIAPPSTAPDTSSAAATPTSTTMTTPTALALTASASDISAPPSSSDIVPLIASAVGGAIAGLLLVGVVVFFVCRTRKPEAPTAAEPASSEYASMRTIVPDTESAKSIYASSSTDFALQDVKNYERLTADEAKSQYASTAVDFAPKDVAHYDKLTPAEADQ